MKKYLGETNVSDKFKNRSVEQNAILIVENYGGSDGSHHKAYCLDQVVRVLLGTPLVVMEAQWDNGHSELRYSTGEPTQQYHDWVAEQKNGEEGPNSYDYNVGIPG